MQYPKFAVAIIDLDGQKFTTDPSVMESSDRLVVPILIENEFLGQITVFYTEPNEFILPEEMNLLEGVAERLGLWYQQQKTHRQLLESERRFRNAILNAPNPIMIHTENGTVLEVNEAWLKSTGYSREEIMTVPEWIHLAHPNITTEIEQRVQRSYAKTFTGHQGVFPVTAKSGDLLHWYFSSAPLGNLPDDQSIVITIAIDITNRVKAEEEKRQYYNRIMAMGELDQVIASTLELDEVLDLITSHLGNLIKFDSMSILSIDGDQLQIIACKGFEFPEEVLKLRFPSEPGYPNYEVIKNRTPLAVTKVSESYPTFSQATVMNLQGSIQSWLGVPLFNRHEVIGMFTIDRCNEDPYSEQDIEIATQYANRAAIAITNARLFEQTNNHLRKLETLRKIDGTITSSKDLSDALHTVLEQVKVGLNVDIAAVFLYDEEEQSLAYQQSFGYRTEGHPDNKVPVGQGYVGTVAAQMKPLYIPEINLTDDGHKYPFSLVNEGIVSYYGFPLITKGKLQGVLQILQRSKLNPSEEWIDFAEALAGQTAIAVDNLILFRDLEQANDELREAYDATIEGWAHALEIRDKETEGHSRRVVQMAEKVAKAFGFDDEALVHLRRGVLLHDIGKMGIPDQILHKPGPLDDAEWEIMRQHPVYANEMLKSIVYLRPALLIPHYHHERWDGSGYPEGLMGEDIPLEARIFSVIDAYDALTSDRPYRGAWSDEETKKYLKKQAGKEFDPAVVEKFLEILERE
ncbi:MAG: GAF domain-containing protein, partial [Anaerolineaceae bacterium]|nr:GAF domain-containing protein [Anaerolineaceae bacterium]